MFISEKVCFYLSPDKNQKLINMEVFEQMKDVLDAYRTLSEKEKCATKLEDQLLVLEFLLEIRANRRH